MLKRIHESHLGIEERKENANPSPSCQISNFRAKIERVSRSNKSIPNPLDSCTADQARMA